MTMAAILIVAMLGLSAFFSGSEIAFVSADRLQAEMKAHQRGVTGRRVIAAFKNPSLVLTTSLVGNNLALVIYSTIMALVLHDPLYTLLAPYSALSPESAVLIAQTIIAASVVLVIGEILPKTVLSEAANRAVFVVAIPLHVTYLILLPLIKLTGWTANLLMRLVGADKTPLSQFPRRAFERIIEESRQRGSLDLDDEESEILSNVFELHNKRVRESMTPRTDIVAVAEDTSLEEFRELCIKSGYSKVPVYRDNPDSIVGIAFAYDLFDEPTSLKEMMHPARFVPESKLSKDLFKEFRDTKSSIVIVIDEYGGTAGLITREDLLEELFGDIQDEFDSEEEPTVQLDSNTFILSGRAEVDELNEQFGLQIPPGDYETIAGFILEASGTIPPQSDTIQTGNFRIVILQATRHRIDSVRLEIIH